jgi:hypothetical protein
LSARLSILAVGVIRRFVMIAAYNEIVCCASLLT